MFFWNYLAFSMSQWMLAIWSLVPLLLLPLISVVGEGIHRHTRKKAMWRWRQRLSYKLRNAENCWQTPEAQRETWSRFPRGPPGGTLPTPWFLASGCLVCERMHLCCFKLPSLWSFVTAALDKHHGNQMQKQELSSFPDSLGTSCFLSQWLWGSDDPNPWVLKESDTT